MLSSAERRVALQNRTDADVRAPRRILLGCAGWSIPAHAKMHFSDDMPILRRYAGRFSAVEINSSFYRSHRRNTYARWADTVPSQFRFSVKAPKEITHSKLLTDCAPLLGSFIADVSALDTHLGCVLFQLPPRLFFDRRVANNFFLALRRCYEGPVVLEPRHATWFAPDAEDLLWRYGIARAAADPKRAESGDAPAGWPDPCYYRLHGSPQMYVSSYPDAYIASLARNLESDADAGSSVWCIFDNTARGEATLNALDLHEALSTHAAA